MTESTEKSDITYTPNSPNMQTTTNLGSDQMVPNFWNPIQLINPHLSLSQLFPLIPHPFSFGQPSLVNPRFHMSLNQISNLPEHAPSTLSSISRVKNEERGLEGSGVPAPESSDGPKRNRTSFMAEQSAILEEVFQMDNYISKTRRIQLAEQLGLPENTIKVWFQNRRMKQKRHTLMLPSYIANNPGARDVVLRFAEQIYMQQQQEDSTNFQLSSGSTTSSNSGNTSTTSNSVFSIESLQ